MKKFSKIVEFGLICFVCMGMSLLLTGCGNKTGETVSVYCFGDYIDPLLIRDFEKETGIKVVYSTFDTNEELYPVIKNNGPCIQGLKPAAPPSTLSYRLTT